MYTDNNKEVALKIKELRVQKDLAQSAIAKELGLTVTAYNRIENNKTQLTINNLFTIAKCLDVGVEYLLQLSIGGNAHNTHNVVMSQFNNGTLHISVSAESFKQLSEDKKQF